MCSVVAAIGGLLTGLQGYASYKSQVEAAEAQADSQASMYRAQAQAAEHNAKIESKKQEQIADNYGQQQRDLRARHRLNAGQVRAQAGAANLDMSGSMLDILSSGQEAYDQDKLTLLTNQRNDNYESRAQEMNHRNEAGAARVAIQNVYADLDRQKNGIKWNSILGTAASIAAPFIGGSGGGGGNGGGSSAGGTTYAGTLYSGTPTSTAGRILSSSWASAKPTILPTMGFGQKGR